MGVHLSLQLLQALYSQGYPIFSCKYIKVNECAPSPFLNFFLLLLSFATVHFN